MVFNVSSLIVDVHFFCNKGYDVILLYSKQCILTCFMQNKFLNISGLRCHLVIKYNIEKLQPFKNKYMYCMCTPLKNYGSNKKTIIFHIYIYIYFILIFYYIYLSYLFIYFLCVLFSLFCFGFLCVRVYEEELPGSIFAKYWVEYISLCSHNSMIFNNNYYRRE